MSDPKLYDIEHPYHCNEGNYFENGHHTAHSTWAEFMAAMGDADKDMNLVYRWDWARPVDDDDRPITYPDPYYRDGTLKLFYMGQRKAYAFSHEVQVCAADEPAVRAWLEQRWEHMRSLWAPLSAQEVTDEKPR